MADNVPTEISVTKASETPDIQAMLKDVGVELGQEHQEWCMEVWSQGAKFAVIPSQIPMKGMGIVAARKIKAQEQIVTIPTAIVFTTDSIASEYKKKYSKLMVHGLFALALAQEKSKAPDRIKKWTRTWPSLEDLQDSLPILLNTKYREPFVISQDGIRKKFYLLPPAVGGTWIDSTGKLETEFASDYMLSKQEGKLKRDLAVINGYVSKHDNSMKDDPLDSNLLIWMWLMVNTRSFYYDMPLRSKPRGNEDKICLCPFVDYFNHTEKGCNVAYNDEGFIVTADRDYEKGEEIMISYGAHNNDLLWTDYGFLLNHNSSDGVCVDAWMLDPRTGIAEPQTRRMLEDAGYWSDGPCYRTEMAIRTQILNRLHWHRLMRGEDIPIPEDKYDQETRDFLKEKVLKPCIDTAKIAQKCIPTISSQLPPSISRFALDRWRQIQIMAEKCL